MGPLNEKEYFLLLGLARLTRPYGDQIPSAVARALTERLNLGSLTGVAQDVASALVNPSSTSPSVATRQALDLVRSNAL